MKKIIFIFLLISGLAPILVEKGFEISSINTVSAQTWDGDFPDPIIISGWEDPNRNDDNLDPLLPDLSGFDIDPVNPNINFPDFNDYLDNDFGDWESDNDEETGNDDKEVWAEERPFALFLKACHLFLCKRKQGIGNQLILNTPFVFSLRGPHLRASFPSLPCRAVQP